MSTTCSGYWTCSKVNGCYTYNCLNQWTTLDNITNIFSWNIDCTRSLKGQTPWYIFQCVPVKCINRACNKNELTDKKTQLLTSKYSTFMLYIECFCPSSNNSFSSLSSSSTLDIHLSNVLSTLSPWSLSLRFVRNSSEDNPRKCTNNCWTSGYFSNSLEIEKKCYDNVLNGN